MNTEILGLVSGTVVAQSGQAAREHADRDCYDYAVIHCGFILRLLFWTGFWLSTGIVMRAEDPKLVFPEKEWEKVKPEVVGYSSEKLNALRAWLKTQQTTALQVSIRGRVVFEYGDVGRVSKVASVRKSILAMLYGNYIAQGKIDPNSTVEQLGLTDVQPFLPVEKGATLQHLLTARTSMPRERLSRN